MDDFISGGRIGCIFDKEARDIAMKLYEQFRRRNDCVIIAKHSGCSVEQVQIVKYYLFFAKHFNRKAEFVRFEPSYDIAESWQRLSEKRGRVIKPHDLLLLKHELKEISILALDPSLSQMQAHDLANNYFNYQYAADNYYRSLGIKVD